MPEIIQFTFSGGNRGLWRVDRMASVKGEPLPAAPRVEVAGPSWAGPAPGAVWSLRGVTSNERYVTAAEHKALAAAQPPLGRPSATMAALIPIRKSARWWDLSQDQRRDILEQRSRHIAIGLEYLPAVARRLHHSRDLGEPFDFLTWFEFAPSEQSAFEQLVERLRETEEWTYVDREIDIRLRLSRRDRDDVASLAVQRL